MKTSAAHAISPIIPARSGAATLDVDKNQSEGKTTPQGKILVENPASDFL